MKTLVYLFAIVTILFAGCAKDEMFYENSNNLELKKAKVPIPMKAEFCMTNAPNPGCTNPMCNMIPVIGAPDFFPIKAFPVYGLISGHATHMGEVITEKSYGIKTSCIYKDFGTPNPLDDELWMESYGRITAANGDSYAFIHPAESPLKIKLNLFYSNIPILPFTGEVIMSDGTGKFEGVSGLVIMEGQTDLQAQTTCWTAEGTMTYKK